MVALSTISTPGGGGAGIPFAMQDDWANLRDDYSVACVADGDISTTLAAEATAGQSYIYVTDTEASYSIGHGISLPGMGVAGAQLLTTVSSRNVNRLNLATTIKTTVAAGGLVYHDGTVGSRAAIEDGNSKRIYVNDGAVMLTSGIDWTKRAKQIIGSNWASDYYHWLSDPVNELGARFVSRFDTDNVFYFGSSHCVLKGVGIQQHSSVERTGGLFIDIGPRFDGDTIYEGNGANYIAGPTISNITMESPWQAIRLGQHFNANIQTVNVHNFLKNGIVSDMPIPYGGSNFWNIKVSGKQGTGGSLSIDTNVGGAYLFNQCDLNNWNNIRSFRTLHGLHFDVATGEHAFGQIMNNIHHDNIVGGNGIKMEIAGTGLCDHHVIVGVGVSGGAVNSYNLGVGCDDNTLIGVHTSQSAKAGIDSGTNNQIVGSV